MNKLYEILKKQIAKEGLTEELKQKIDVFYLAGRLTEEEYKDLMGLNEETEETVEETAVEEPTEE